MAALSTSPRPYIPAGGVKGLVVPPRPPATLASCLLSLMRTFRSAMGRRGGRCGAGSGDALRHAAPPDARQQVTNTPMIDLPPADPRGSFPGPSCMPRARPAPDTHAPDTPCALKLRHPAHASLRVCPACPALQACPPSLYGLPAAPLSQASPCLTLSPPLASSPPPFPSPPTPSHSSLPSLTSLPRPFPELHQASPCFPCPEPAKEASPEGPRQGPCRTPQAGMDSGLGKN